MLTVKQIKRYKVRLRRAWRYVKSPRLAILGLTLLLTILPFWIKSNDHAIKSWMSNRAMAATMATVKSGQAETYLTKEQRIRHGKAVKSLVAMRPDALLELHGSDLLSGFDDPDLTREEGAFTVFQYKAGSCVVDIFLAAQNAEGVSRVVHYEVRMRQKASLTISERSPRTAPQTETCIRSL